MITGSEGDNCARIMLRFDELFQSAQIIKDALATLPEGTIRLGGRITAGRTKHTIEAPRGDLTYDIEVDENGQVISVAIQTPSIMNVEVGSHAMMKNLASCPLYTPDAADEGLGVHLGGGRLIITTTHLCHSKQHATIQTNDD